MDKIQTAIKVGDTLTIAQLKSGDINAYYLLFSDGHFYTLYPGDEFEIKLGDLQLSLSL